MTRDDGGPLSEAAISELAAIDAALRGEQLPTEHGELGELALLLRDERPRPGERFSERLDERIARGSAPPQRDPNRRAARRPATGAGARTLLARVGLMPALAAGVVVVLAIPAAIALLDNGSSVHATSGKAVGVVAGASRHARTEATRPSAAAGINNGVVTTPLPAHKGVQSPPSNGAAAPSSAARSVQRTATLELGVAGRQLQSVDQQIFSLVSSFHGYVLQSSSTSGSEQQGSASFQLRVPSASTSGTIAAVSQLGRVLSENNTTNDVTEQLGSLQRSLTDARAQRTGLLRQLAAATSAQQAAALHARLGAVEARISELAASLRSVTGNVQYTTISLTLTGERAGAGGAGSGDLTPGGAVRDAGQILSAALAVFLLAAAATLPVAVALLLGWAAVVSLRRRQRESALDGG